eukprot:scaffold4081_cov34-Prasinocladus_malaysianus.AAC.2
MVAYDLALAASTAAGAVYTASLGAAPDVYLDKCNTLKTFEARALTRSTAAGLAGLTAACYMGHQSGSMDVKRAALTATTTGLVGYATNNLHRVIKSDAIAPKVDLAVSAGLAGLCIASLVRNKAHKTV